MFSVAALSAGTALVGVLVSLWTGGVLVRGERVAAEEQLERRATLVEDAVAKEAGRYVDALRTVAAALGAREELTAVGFQETTRGLAGIGLAGASSVVFLVPVNTDEVELAQREWRERGVPDLVLHPNAAVDEHLFSVLSVSLDGVDEVRQGIDATRSEPAARALREARRARHVALSDPYQLIIDESLPAEQRQLSFAMAAPVLGLPDARGGRAFLGWVLLGMRGQDFVGDTLSRVSQDALDVTLRAPGADGTSQVVAARRATVPGDRDLSWDTTVEVAGRRWHVQASAASEWQAGAGVLPVVVAVSCSTLSLLLGALVWVLASGRARAREQVRSATAELAEAEVAARRQAELMTTIMDNISDGVGVVDHNGEFLLHNPAAKALLGLGVDRDGADNWQDHYGIYRPDGRTPFPTEELPLVRALGGKPCEQVEMVIRNAGRPDGVTITVSARPLPTADGPHGAVAVFHDISARKHAEARLAAAAEELRAAHDDLVAQKDYLVQVLDVIDVGVVTCDAAGVLTHANRAARAGLADGEPAVDGTTVVARDPGQPAGAGTDLGPSFQETAALSAALAGVHVDGLEISVPLSDGSDRVVLMHARPLRDPAGRVLGAVAASSNITALREREAELRAFAAVVAHDLKSPLTAVGGFSALLVDDLIAGRPTIELVPCVEGIEAGVGRMVQLIDGLLTYATTRDASLSLEPVDLSAMVRQVVAERTDHLRTGSTQLFPDIYTGPLPVVHGDPFMIRQLLDNLIGNAMKYTVAGQAARIDISARPDTDDPDRVRIEIADRGVGIPAHEQPHVFTAFHRAAAHNHYTGTGLGLAICHRIVHRHGGVIFATDNPGGGTRIHFTLSRGLTEPASTVRNRPTHRAGPVP